jgi:hypothetical protein
MKKLLFNWAISLIEPSLKEHIDKKIEGALKELEGNLMKRSDRYVDWIDDCLERKVNNGFIQHVESLKNSVVNNTSLIEDIVDKINKVQLKAKE